jgi:hypothetical protein
VWRAFGGTRTKVNTHPNQRFSSLAVPLDQSVSQLTPCLGDMKKAGFVIRVLGSLGQRQAFCSKPAIILRYWHSYPDFKKTNAGAYYAFQFTVLKILGSCSNLER